MEVMRLTRKYIRATCSKNKNGKIVIRMSHETGFTKKV